MSSAMRSLVGATLQARRTEERSSEATGLGGVPVTNLEVKLTPSGDTVEEDG